jgi:hypothetical protein
VSIQGKCTREDLLTLRDILDNCVVHTASSCSNDLCWTTRWLVAVAPWMRSRNMPLSSTVSNDVTNLTTIVACVGHYAHLLWQWVQHSRWGYHSSRRDVQMLWYTNDRRMMMLLGWVVLWSTNHPVLGRSTPGWGCQSHLHACFLGENGLRPSR